MKKGILYTLMALALVLAVTFAFAAPAMAQTTVSVTKETYVPEGEAGGVELVPGEEAFIDGMTVYYMLEIPNVSPDYEMHVRVKDRYAVDISTGVVQDIPNVTQVLWWHPDPFDPDPLIGSWTDEYPETTNVVIQPGDTWFGYISFVIGEDDPQWDPESETTYLANRLETIGVWVRPGMTNLPVDGAVTVTSTVVEPDISVTKDVSHDTSKEGDEVVYTICIENTGDWPLEGITVIDSLLGDISASFPDYLDVGESHCEDFDYEIPEGAPNPLINEVVVTGFAEDFDPAIAGATVTAEDSALVDLVSPGLEITKEADTDVSKEGDPINYTVVVTNTGDVALEVVVTDSLVGELFDDDLAAGASETFEYEYIVPEGAPDPLVNTATAVGTLEYLGLDNVYTVDAEVSIGLVYPGLEITKTADTDVSKEGDPINYTVVVTNTGDVALEVVVTDSLVGELFDDDRIGNL